MGHTNCVMDATFNPDGSLVASGSCDGTVRLWDVKSVREIRALTRQHSESGPDDPDSNIVTSVNYSPDGRMLFVSYQDGDSEIWDFSRPSRFRELEPKVEQARSELRRNPRGPASLRTLADWYEMRGAWNWAAELLTRSSSETNPDDLARIARCYWLAGRGDLALPVVQRVLDAKGPSQGYVRLLRDSILADASAPKRFKVHDDRAGDRYWSQVGFGAWQETQDGQPPAEYQVAGRMTAMGKQGSLFIKLPGGQPEPATEQRVFVADDGSTSASQNDPADNWKPMGQTSLVKSGPAPAGTSVGGDPSAAAAKAKLSQVERLLKAAADAESKGDFAGAAALFTQASQYDAKTAADAADLIKSSRAKLDEGNPKAALDILNAAAPRIRSAQAVAALAAEIADLKDRAAAYNVMGSSALQQKAYDQARADFVSAARGGLPEGMLHLGDMYKNGMGVPPDPSLAKIWWQRAADAGNAEAKKRLTPGSGPGPMAFPVGHSG
jgi:tetratricopeptide (TPR) repeat protein